MTEDQINKFLTLLMGECWHEGKAVTGIPDCEEPGLSRVPYPAPKEMSDGIVYSTRYELG
jgi:hypothetical protein